MSLNATDGPWQFRLWHIFALTTFVAVAAALVRVCGPRLLMPLTGLLLARLNYGGLFRIFQTRWRVYVWPCAWLAFLISLGLPSIRVFGPVLGIYAAWIALTAPFNMITRLSPDHLAYDWTWATQSSYYLTITLANLLMLLLPVVHYRISCGRGQTLSTALCISMVMPWSTFIPAGDALPGYYLWCGSFALALVSLSVTWQTLVAMVAMAVFSLLVLPAWMQ